MLVNREEELDRLRNISKEELLVEIGGLLLDDNIYGEGDKLKKAKEWMIEKEGKIRLAICKEDGYKQLKATYEQNDFYEAFMLICDGLLSPYFGSFPLFSIARLVLFEGLDKYCDQN